MLDEGLKVGWSLGEHGFAFVRRLKRIAPDLRPAGLVEIREKLHEADYEIGLSEQGIDGKIHLQPLAQFEELRLDGGRWAATSAGGRVSKSSKLKATRTPLMGWRGRLRLSRSRKAAQLF